MATHSSILTSEFPWTEESGRLQSIGLQRVGHNGSSLACKQKTAKILLLSLVACLLWQSVLLISRKPAFCR